MSPSNSVHASLESIGFVQLVLLFATLIAYGLALSEAFPARLRRAAAAAALLAGLGFSVATPAWPDGIVLLALAIVAVAGVTGAAWLLASLLRLDETARPASVEPLPAAERTGLRVADAALQPARAAAGSS